MTVKYNLAVSTSRPWTLFKLLYRWRGSIWKSVLLEFFIWLIMFAIITVIYRTVLSPSQATTFERFVHYCDDKLDYIPLNFMLGFFVTSVVNRWLRFFDNIGYIDNITLMVAAYVRGTDEKTRMMRRNIARYCVLSQALVFRDISMKVRKRFPTIDSLVTAGFMMQHEKDRYEEFSQFRYNRYWMPFQWSLALCHEARIQQKISSDILLAKISEEIKKFRTCMATLCNFDWVPLPIMYPQLIVLAVHTYFIVCVFSRQFVITEDAPNKTMIDMYFPIMTALQFVFYMGWLKVAEAMLNPFGEDDDDFECNFLLDKNLSLALTVVDQGYDKTPSIERDAFWDDEVRPLYTIQSVQEEQPRSYLTGSTANVIITERSSHDFDMLPLPNEDLGSIPSNHSFGFIQESLKKVLSSKGHMNDKQKSHFLVQDENLSTDRKHKSANNLSTIENGYWHTYVGKPRSDSLDLAFDGLITDPNTWRKFSADSDPLPRPSSFDQIDLLPHPTPTLFHLGLHHPHIPHELNVHKLEDLQEENEDIGLNMQNVNSNAAKEDNLNNTYSTREKFE